MSVQTPSKTLSASRSASYFSVSLPARSTANSKWSLSRRVTSLTPHFPLRPTTSAAAAVPGSDNGGDSLSLGSPTLTVTLTREHGTPVGAPASKPSAMVRVLGEQATIGVTSGSVAASVVGAGLISSGVVTRVPMMRALANSIRCAWAEQDFDERPSYFDLPLQFVAIGDHPKLRYYAGGVVLCGSFILLWELASLLCFKLFSGRLHRQVERLVGIGSILWQGYLLPNIAQFAVVVMWHAGEASTAAAAALPLGASLVSSLAKWLWVLLPPQFARNAPPMMIDHSEDGRTVKVRFLKDSPSAQSWLRFFGPLIDGTVDPGRTICRVVVVEEIAVGILLGVLAGLKPESDDSCRYTSGAMCAVTVLHLGYLLGIRPHRTRLDATFANLNAFLMFGQSTFAVVITVEHLDEGPVLTCFGVLGLAQLLIVFIQLIVGGFYAHMLTWRRRILSIRSEQDETSPWMVPIVTEVAGRAARPLLNDPGPVVELNPLVTLRQSSEPVPIRF